MGAREVLLTIEAWMAGLRRAVMMNRLQVSVLAAIAGLIAVSLVIMTVEAVGHLSGTARAVLLALWALFALAALGLGLLWPVLRYTLFAPSDKDLARVYAGRMPSIRDRVLNALQLLERAENAGREGYSQELILEAGRGVAEDLQPVDPRTLPAREPVRLSGKLALISGAAAVIFMLVAGRPLLSAAERVMKPGEDFEPPAPFTLAVSPGAAHLVRGDSLVVEVTAAGAVPASVIIERLENGKTATEPVEVKSGTGVFRYTYRGVTAPFTYWAHSGRVTSPEYEVEVEELPAIRFLSVRLSPPAYTKLDEQVLEENVGDIAAVVGTRVELQLAATKTLTEARLEFLTARVDSLTRGEVVASPHGPLTRRAAKALDLDGSRAEGDFTIDESGYYRINLEDREGRLSRDPILYRITARPDEPPLVTITEPARDVEIAANVKIAVAAEAMDDFGFSKMALRYHRPAVGEPEELRGDDAQYKTVPLNWRRTEPGKAAAEYVWDLAPLDLLPEDEVLFFVEVWDNDAVHGPKRARSETRTLRFPSMAEIFDQQQKEAETREISLADLMKESQSVREEVEKAVEEFKSNPDMNWERKQDLQKLLEKQQAMNDVLNQVADAMQKAAEQMDQRAMFSPEVMQKMQQIQELVQKVITPEMRKALEKLAKSMQQPTEEEMRQALENFKMTQEMFERALDQTLNMLKQLEMAQKLDELTRRLDELGRQQEQLNQKMDQNTPESAAKNSEQQQKLSEEMKKIEQEMRKLAEQMQQQPQQKGQEKMQALKKKMEQDQLSEQMQQNSSSMSMCQNQSAKKKGRQIRREMSEMANMMQSLRQEMNQDQLAEVLAKLERARDQVLDLLDAAGKTVEGIGNPRAGQSANGRGRRRAGESARSTRPRQRRHAAACARVHVRFAAAFGRHVARHAADGPGRRCHAGSRSAHRRPFPPAGARRAQSNAERCELILLRLQERLQQTEPQFHVVRRRTNGPAAAAVEWPDPATRQHQSR